MLSRTEILNSYSIDKNGKILSPGKFEQERLYMPVIHELSLHGFGEEHFRPCICPVDPSGEFCACEPEIDFIKVEIDESLHNEFPELGDKRAVYFYETEHGFVIECRTPEGEEE